MYGVQKKSCTGIDGVGWEGRECKCEHWEKGGEGQKKFPELMQESHSISLKRKPPKNFFNQPIPQPKAPSRFPYSIQITALNLALPLFICSSASPA